MMLDGHCLCGAVTFRVPEVHAVDACHCGMCRRWSGGPFFACQPGGIEWTGTAPATYRSSDWAERGFCATCGTVLFYRLVETGHLFLNPFAIDGLGEVAFETEVHVEEQPAFYRFANETRRMTGEEVIAAFAGGKD